MKARGPQSLDKAVGLCHDLCLTVQGAHKNKVLHRDLKPDNIIVRDFDKNELVIIDYGLSFNYDDLNVTESSAQLRNRFLALPEMNTPNSDFYDPRSDITVMSGILYFLLTGHRPGHLIDGNNRLPHRRGELSVRRYLSKDTRCEQVEILLDRGLARDLNDRFQSWGELIERLKGVVQPYSLDEQDTIALAKKLRGQLNVSNQKARLANLKDEVKGVKEAIMRFIQSLFMDLMPTFNLSMMGNFPLDRPALPPGMTDVDSSLTTEMLMQHNPHSVHTMFAIVLRGSECVLMCFRGMVNVPGKNRIEVSPWEELLCFDPKNPPAAEVIQKFARSILNRNMSDMYEAAPKDCVGKGRPTHSWLFAPIPRTSRLLLRPIKLSQFLWEAEV